MTPRARLLALVLVAASLAGCASPCLRVQQQLCACRHVTNDARRACESTAENQERLLPPDADALAVCAELEPGCAQLIAEKGCAALDLDEGKRACGVAEP